jgi:putative oxidoreductase
MKWAEMHHAEQQSLLTSAGTLVDVQSFHMGGTLQLRDPGGTIQYFASLDVPVPEVAVWVSIAIHLLGGLAMLAGFKTRWAAAALALLCLGTAFGVHLPAGDTENMINFYKNLVMTGGFLYVISFGAGAISFDEGLGLKS